jgi:hypothetical protein
MPSSRREAAVTRCYPDIADAERDLDNNGGMGARQVFLGA